MAPRTEETAGLRFFIQGHLLQRCIQPVTCLYISGEKMMKNSNAAAGGSQYGQRMIFTGPDGIGDYRPRSNYFPWYIGVGVSSPEATGDLSYLCRAAPHAPHPAARHSHVGEVGWGWQYNQLLNSGTLHSDMQIKKTEIRAALEDRVTQRFQNKQNNTMEESLQLQVNTKSPRGHQS
ncbi:uncharacterized protein C4orf45 [Notolabrus celidotus]|uniref:uncharacterized protein C4orf45 n=1 Tax=Notolabrus celidotus TaxID=1203425 RepID=UPI00148F83BC|nr:uncharacterized protein C4orf45 [Notolabrus celidotus]XP_034545626.1 uncharacterized protein C4orf45 [Notolabrus celidotus]